MKYECPICHAELEHERINDGYIVHRIKKNGEVIEQANHSDGNDNVRCSETLSHEIPDRLINEVIDLVG